MIKLVSDTIDNKEIDKLIKWLKKYPRLTKGTVTKQFEEEWSKEIGVKYSLYVNSGSSANLLMVYALMLLRKEDTRKNVIVPAVSWSTSVAPIIQLGLNPIFCDCNMINLGLDTNQLETLCDQYNPLAILSVNPLGFIPDMDEIQRICKKTNIFLLEDSCETFGTTFNNKKAGTFGIMSTFSLYYGHHLSTIEGGIVCTDNEELYDILLSIRSHGWDRDLSKDKQKKLREENNVDLFNSLYTFYYPGFNFRATDLQAFIGLSQLEKADKIIKTRERNFNYYNKYISCKWKPNTFLNEIVSNFAYPVIHKRKNEIVNKLIEAGVEVRPLICGSMLEQPFIKNNYDLRYADCKNAAMIHHYGFYLPNHIDIGKEEIKFICDIINKY
jgi:CDP-6-deoxy-D-xylo-4-hexulose-3-dehydrase